MSEKKIYACIDLKSFYASVECVERGLDPFSINLVVADPSRGGGAITLAATPAIKKLGVPSRGRIYEIPKGIEYIIATPRMHLYMEYSAKIYAIFLRYVAPEDIHVYSCDESFLDLTPYLTLYQMNGKTLARKIMDDIYATTGITATAGIGTNLFLAKVALDITAKHTMDNMGYLDEALFRQTLWHHKPLTDFWMIGAGTMRRLEHLGIQDLYGVSHYSEDILYKVFGVNAQYLIDHAWGREPTEIADIKKYKPSARSISNSQILFEDYSYDNALLVMKEMVDSNALTLTERHLVTNRISLYIGYSKDVIKASNGVVTMTNTTNSYSILLREFVNLYHRIVNPAYSIRRIGIGFHDVKNEIYESYDLFTDYAEMQKERQLQASLVEVRSRYGKSAALKGISYLDHAMARKRNQLIGGHNAY